MTDAGLIVITAFISPFRAERRLVREMMAPGEFIEIYVDTPLVVAETRACEGSLQEGRRGELKISPVSTALRAAGIPRDSYRFDGDVTRTGCGPDRRLSNQINERSR